MNFPKEVTHFTGAECRVFVFLFKRHGRLYTRVPTATRMMIELLLVRFTSPSRLFIIIVHHISYYVIAMIAVLYPPNHRITNKWCDNDRHRYRTLNRMCSKNSDWTNFAVPLPLNRTLCVCCPFMYVRTASFDFFLSMGIPIHVMSKDNHGMKRLLSLSLYSVRPVYLSVRLFVCVLLYQRMWSESSH